MNKENEKFSKGELSIESLELSEEQLGIFTKIENSNQHAFITGKAGTGKSVLLQYFRQHSKKKLVVVAPTGIAAMNVGGQTMHSLFRLPLGLASTADLRLDADVSMILKNVDALVVDEASMVRADQLDAIDQLFRRARKKKHTPFGGVQAIFFGDVYQLSPVVPEAELRTYFSEELGGYYFFNARVWREAAIPTYELGTIFRQQDVTFRDLLDEIRTGRCNESTLEQLNKRAGLAIPESKTLVLATTRNIVHGINGQRLAQLKGKEHTYHAFIQGELQESSHPTDASLFLKKGAQVVMVKNDKEKRWVNGSLAYIDELKDDEIIVDIDGAKHTVQRETWYRSRYYYDKDTKDVKEETVSSFVQFPLKLAWAITIHKAQGQSYESVVVDLGYGAFAHGQTYVALSRCRSLEGLYLRRPLRQRDIIVDPAVIAFMNGEEPAFHEDTIQYEIPF